MENGQITECGSHEQLMEKEGRYYEMFEIQRYGCRNTQIPEVLLSYILNFLIYAFVCINALKGLFRIGSVIMYVGYIGRFISAAKDMAANIAMFRMNVTFLANYLDYIQIIKTVHQGMLIPEICDADKYEIEFCNVSFKYPGANYELVSI